MSQKDRPQNSLNRRQTLQLFGTGLLAVPSLRGLSAQTGTGTTRIGLADDGVDAARLAVLDIDWNPVDPASALDPLLEALRAERLENEHLLILAPQADTLEAYELQPLLEALGALCRRFDAWLATSARVLDGDSDSVSGFLIDSAGRLRLLTHKSTPEVASGFRDCPAMADRPRRFETADTPFGVVGLLPGEDLLIPGFVRATVYAGAELILSPGRTVPPGTAPAISELATSIAYENWCAVALAYPAGPASYGDLTLDTLEQHASRGPLTIRFEPAVLRQARHLISPNLYDNFPLWVRDELFARIFSHQATESTSSARLHSRQQWQAEAVRRQADEARRVTPDSSLWPSYVALAVQPATMATLPVRNRRAALRQNIDTALAQVGGLAAAPLAKIALFPEFCFSGAGYRSVPDLITAAVELPGPEMARLQEWARANSIYVAAQFMEIDPEFPSRVFNTAILLDDSGELLLKHRKLQCVDIYGALPDTTPGSIFDQYVARHGVDDLCRIVDTPLGRIGVIICFEIVFPEIVRAMANQGVELVLHLTAEGYSSLRPAWHALRRKRAFENQAYLLCSNKGYDPKSGDRWISYGESQFIDFRGRERDRLAGNVPGVLMATIDMQSLRAARRDPRLNLRLWDEPGAYAHAYDQGLGIANNGWTGDPLQSPYARVDGRITALADVQERFYSRGVYRH